MSWAPELNAWLRALDATSTNREALRYLAVFLALLPATFLFGALFPLSLRIYCGDGDGVRQRVGQAYAVNTLAGIAGSLLAGFFVIPHFGTDATLRGSALLVGVVPLICLRHITSPRGRRWVLGLTLPLLVAGPTLPGLDYIPLLDSVGYAYNPQRLPGELPEVLFLREGHTAVISVVAIDNRLAWLQSNGLKEAEIDRLQVTVGEDAESLLGLTPALLHPAPRRALVVGMGGGTTTRALLATGIESVRVVEIEPEVLAAVRAVAPSDDPVLNDPRVEFVINDARNTLVVEEQLYDIIASQPSHPWLAGVGNLFTAEFFAIVSSRLAPGGVYAQWLNLFRMDVDTLRSVLAAFYGEFSHGFTLAFSKSGDLLLIGSKTPLVFDAKRVAERMAASAGPWRDEGRGLEHLLTSFCLSRREALEAAGDAPPNSDLSILTEVRLGRAAISQGSAEALLDFLEQHRGHDLLPFLDPAQAADTLEALALLFKRLSPRRAWRVRDRLETIDPLRAQALEARLGRRF